MRNQKPLFVWLFLSALLVVIGKYQVDAKFSWRYPLLNQLIPTEHFSMDLGALALGSHRVAANVGYIQFLQYYGVKEKPKEGKETDEDSGHEDHLHDRHKPGGYSLLYPKGERILMLDPFFHSAALEVGAALGFNVQRPDEAIKFLQMASNWDPTFWRYRLYLAAILFKKEERVTEFLGLLDEAIQYSDCPPLLENILANLHKKYGNFKRAGEVYVHIIQTAVNDSDRTSAQNNLLTLLQTHPTLTPHIEALLLSGSQ